MKRPSQIARLALALFSAIAIFPQSMFAQEEAWVSIGKGVYYDDLLTAISNVTPASWEVEIEQSAENPGIYRLKDVMRSTSNGGNMPYTFPSSLTYASPAYLYIDASDPNAVYVKDSFSGLRSNGKDYYFSSKVHFYVNSDSDLDLLKRSHPEYFGTLVDGTISFTNGSEVCWRIGAQYKEANTSKALKISLPDAKDYSLDVESSLCGVDNKVPVRIAAGKDVSSLKMLFAYGFCEGSPSLYEAYEKAYASQLQDVNAGTITVRPSREGRWSCIIFAYNGDGRMVNAFCAPVYCKATDSEEWTDLGDVEYTDVIVAPQYSSLESATYNVNVQQSAENPGLYRLVDPYGDAFLAATGKSNAHEPSCSHHYIYIDATDPERVVMKESSLGLNLGFGEMAVIGLAQYFLNYKIDADKIADSGLYGTFKDDVISFPAKCIMFTETGYNNAEWVETDPDGQFRIDLSKRNGVADEELGEDTDAQAEYFNLQGVKVENPSKGQILIRKQGCSVSKIVYN